MTEPVGLTLGEVSEVYPSHGTSYISLREREGLSGSGSRVTVQGGKRLKSVPATHLEMQ